MKKTKKKTSVMMTAIGQRALRAYRRRFGKRERPSDADKTLCAAIGVAEKALVKS